MPKEGIIVDRRDILKVAAGGVAAALTGTSSQVYAQSTTAAAVAPEKLRIDVHGHYYPVEYLDMLDEYGGGGTGTAIARKAPLPGGGGSPEELEARFEMMDNTGVEMMLLSAAPQLPYFENEEHGITAARYINDAYADMVEQHPDRFAAYAVTPLPHVDASLEEMTRALDTLGMVGVTMGTSVMCKSVTDPAFDPFWEEMNRRGSILFFHPEGVGACSAMVNAYNLTWPIGATIEDTMLTAHLIAQGIPSRYPNVRIIVPHLGGEISNLMSRLDNQFGMYMKEGMEMPSITAKRFWYDTVSHAHVPALRCACDSFGADRVVLGSDYPYEVGNMYQRCVDYVGDVGLTLSEVEGILDRNAQALFQLIPGQVS
ncbi:MAG: amidohydrolase [Proteobacteria bacterium]|jgi:6-methylsalicylate decarboxylase|nr:amidohydrolase [Pseudomonadota bacterium]